MNNNEKETLISLKNDTGENVDFIVRYLYIEGNDGCWYLPNGDPGYPPTPPELEITSIKLFSEGQTELIDFIRDEYYEKFETIIFEMYD